MPSSQRLSLTRNGRVRYELKTPWRNGTIHVVTIDGLCGVSYHSY